VRECASITRWTHAERWPFLQYVKQAKVLDERALRVWTIKCLSEVSRGNIWLFVICTNLEEIFSRSVLSQPIRKCYLIKKGIKLRMKIAAITIEYISALSRTKWLIKLTFQMIPRHSAVNARFEISPAKALKVARCTSRSWHIWLPRTLLLANAADLSKLFRKVDPNWLARDELLPPAMQMEANGEQGLTVVEITSMNKGTKMIRRKDGRRGSNYAQFLSKYF